MEPLLYKIIFASFVVFVPFAVSAAAGDVVINEIAWMGTEANPADEWIEILNVGSGSINLSGWGIYEAGGATLVEELAGVIGQGEYFLIERSDDATTDISASQPPTAWGGSGFSNSGEHLVLKDGAGVIIDAVDALSGWFAGDNATRATMERIDPKKDGSLASNWATNNSVKRNGNDAAGNVINGTPKQENSAFNNPLPPFSSDSSPSSSLSSLSSSPSHPIYPALTVDAGSDKTVLAGSSVSFSGLALGINGAPLFDARFLWNFGDGVVQEGRALEHVYYFPGAYTAALTVASGPYSGFDTAVIAVVAPALHIKNMQTGEDGFVVLANDSDAKLDLGGIILRDSAGAQFLIPKHTFVLAKGDITFPNQVSGVLKSGGTVALYNAVGRPLREQPRTANEQPRTAIQTETAKISPPVKGETLKVVSETQDNRDEILAIESAPDTKETAAASLMSQSAGFVISKTALFFGASILVGVISAAGFFLLKTFF